MSTNHAAPDFVIFCSYSCLLSPNTYLTRCFVPNILNKCSFLSLTDSDSHLYEATDNTGVFRVTQPLHYPLQYLLAIEIMK